MDPTSPEDYAGSDAESVGDESDIKPEQGQHDQVSPLAGPPGSGKVVSAGKSSSHHQKRRRVTRACDECRKKKIKCDGKQPCTHCTVYSYGRLLTRRIWCLSLRLTSSQNVRTISRRTDDGTLRRSTSRTWSTERIELSLFCTFSSQTLT